MIRVAEALEIVRRACVALPVEGVPLSEALGRVAARDVASDVDWPPFDTSAMDGYAVRVAEARGGLRERAGLVAAGDAPPAALGPAEAVRVMTGAPLPPGTEAVVPVEAARRDAGAVFAETAPSMGEHIRRRGESVRAGATLVPGGRRLEASDLALAALSGADPIACHARPRVAIAVTGSELVPAHALPRPGQLRDSNGPMLAALVRTRGGAPEVRRAVADRPEAVERLFAEAGGGADLLVTSGGVSAGDLDLLPAAAAAAGFEMLFHGVAMRPGKPVAFARRGRALWLGLPGNPVSSAVCFQLFGAMALDALSGVPEPGPRFVVARLESAVSVRGRRETFRDAILSAEDGFLRVRALETLGSHDLAAHGRANAALRIPAEAERLEAGALVECLPLRPIP